MTMQSWIKYIVCKKCMDHGSQAFVGVKVEVSPWNYTESKLERKVDQRSFRQQKIRPLQIVTQLLICRLVTGLPFLQWILTQE